MEAIDPTQLVTEIPDGQMPQGAERVTLAMAGMQPMGALPVEEIALPGEDSSPRDEDALTPAEQQELQQATAPHPSVPPGAPEPQAALPGSLPQYEADAMRQRMAVLEAELTAMRAAPQPIPSPAPSATPLVDPTETMVSRVANRMNDAFARIESLDAEAPDYAQARAQAYAQAIVQSVLGDVIGTADVPSMVRQQAEQAADARVRAAFAAQQQANTQVQAAHQVITQAVDAARQAGYDVHPIGTSEHFRSKESVQFWALSQALSQAGRTIDEDLRTILGYMPPKAGVPAASEPELRPRNQPMGRQATVPTPGSGTPPQGEYQPKTMNQMLEGLVNRQRIGGTA
jgi:hypothetical protein